MASGEQPYIDLNICGNIVDLPEIQILGISFKFKERRYDRKVCL